jgi:hypothetical protein
MVKTERGEEQPDPEEPSGGTPDDRDTAELLEGHSRPATSPTDQEASRPDPDVS